MPFQKGKSGNPGGRKKPSPQEIDFRAKCRENTEESLLAIKEMAKNSPDDGIRLKARIYLMDQGWGKAPQAVELKGDKERPLRAILEVVQKKPSTDGG